MPKRLPTVKDRLRRRAIGATLVPTVRQRRTMTLLFADATLAVVDKPAGLLAVPGRGVAGLDNAWARLQQQLGDVLVVHRLDMATSGLLLFARGAAAQRALSQAFADRAVAKSYVAVVTGSIVGDSGRIALPLAADWPNRPRQKVDLVQGKPALTLWQVLARDAAAARTRLRLEPVTGRTHQLRVHLAASGHAIVGDALYAAPALAAAAPRLLLHATTLALRHPVSGAELAFESPPPF